VGRNDPAETPVINAEVGEQLRTQRHYDHEIDETDELQRRQCEQDRVLATGSGRFAWFGRADTLAETRKDH
jgi:hypothetical protein